MRCNIFVLTHLSLYAEDIWKIHNYRTEHKLVPFRQKNIWLGCRADFVLGNLPNSFANRQDASKPSTKYSSLTLLPNTSTSFWFGLPLSLNSVHWCFVGFGLTVSYPVAGREGVVAVDTRIFSRDFISRAAYEVPSLRIEDSDDRIVDNITLPSLFLGRSWSHFIRLMSTMLRKGKQTVARLSWYFFGRC